MAIKKVIFSKISFHFLMFAFFGLTSFFVLSYAYYSQYVDMLEPCNLCLYQRYPYWIAIGLSVFGLFLYKKSKIRFVLYAFLFFTFAANVGISFYHFGIEQAWWTDHEICGSTLGDEDDIDEMRKQILATPVVQCAIVQWSLFGLSMTGYNFILSCFLMILSFLGIIKKRSSK
ncbi:MAG: disulfide bond formation protein B [Alphaproteobacteria bacterium]|nr:disulfide bond formation protein B [Alphaproteobacteria bacterium]